MFFEQSGSNKADILIGSRWSFNVSGLYQVAPERPWGFNVGRQRHGREGYISPPFARQARHGVGQRNVQLTDDLDDFRNDDVYAGQCAHRQGLHVRRTSRLNLSLDGFNLTNEDTVLQVERNSRAGSRTFDVNESLSPRVFRAGATIRFR